VDEGGEGADRRVLLSLPESCSVRVSEKRKKDGRPVEIMVGDSVWWQADCVMWTPAANSPGNRLGDESYRCGEHFDIVLSRLHASE
jgi:hypothetical protein